MKKLCFLAVLALFGLNASAQGDDGGSDNSGFRAGINFGLPLGDADMWSSFTLNLDLEYDWGVSDDVSVGVGTGYTNYFGKDGIDGFSYIPVVASIDVNITDDLSAGGDAGYAINITMGGNGGDFMYRFQVRYQASEEVDIQARHSTLSGDGASLSYLSIGVGYSF